MQTREKILAGVLAAVLVGWVVVPSLIGTVLEPVRTREANVRSLRGVADERGEEELASIRAAGQLSQWAARSLDPDPLAAQRTYQSWLTDLADRCGWSQTAVTPLRTSRIGDVASAVEVKLEGAATADQLARFLDLLTGSGLAQSIVQTQVRSQSTRPDDPLEVALRVEALSMPDGGRRPLPYRTFTVAEASEGAMTVSPADGRFDGDFRVAGPDGQALTVTDVEADGAWTFDGPTPSPGDELRVLPPPREDSEAAPWTLLAEQGPFAIPVRKPPILPQVVAPEEVRVVRGNPIDVPLQVVGLPPGDVSLTVAGESPPGLTIDPDTRRLKWKTDDATPLGTVEVALVATGGGVTGRGRTRLTVARPNSPPAIAASEPVAAYPGRPWELPLEITDAEGDDVRLSVTGPADVRLDERTLRWTPTADDEGETFDITVTATDMAEDPMTGERTFSVPVEFDTERTTELIGSVRIDGEPAALLIDRRTGQRRVAREGDELSVGRMKARVQQIGDRSVRLREGEGETLLKLGQSVAERTAAG